VGVVVDVVARLHFGVRAALLLIMLGPPKQQGCETSEIGSSSRLHVTANSESVPIAGDKSMTS
jgi:hypothetical protein